MSNRIAIIRARRAKAIDFLKDRLYDDGDYGKEAVLGFLDQALRENVEQVFVLLAIYEQTSRCVGHIIATSEQAKKHVWIWQAVIDSDTPPDLGPEMFRRLIDWTEHQGKSSIRMESSRSDKAWERRYEFKQISSIFEYKISPKEQMVSYIFDVREVNNGQEQQTADGVRPEPGSTGHLEHSSGHAGDEGSERPRSQGPRLRTDGSTSDSVQRGSDSDPKSGLRVDNEGDRELESTEIELSDDGNPFPTTAGSEVGPTVISAEPIYVEPE